VEQLSFSVRLKSMAPAIFEKKIRIFQVWDPRAESSEWIEHGFVHGKDKSKTQTVCVEAC
jgi:hypothetical protein